ncbi:hypothetical protein AAG589_07350 [Isoptericola sp. F-RaC21]|uniref:hypothetical protein n=1 Tax=Isoptericola sp. F-RaC21 TaxID=3141452 RepID=UPI00315BF143
MTNTDPTEPWRLWLADGGALVAELHVDPARSDFPFLCARVERGPAFGPVAQLFADEVRLSEAEDEDDDSDGEDWEAAYAAIRAATRLTSPDGRTVPEYLLHVDGDEAWWRWSDETFG